MKIFISFILMLFLQVSLASNITLAAIGYCQDAGSGSPLANTGGGTCTDVSTDRTSTGFQEYNVTFKSCANGKTPTIIALSNLYYYPSAGTGNSLAIASYVLQDQIQQQSCTVASGLSSCLLDQYIKVCSPTSTPNSTCTYQNAGSISGVQLGASYTVLCS